MWKIFIFMFMLNGAALAIEPEKNLNVFAAASLTDALHDISRKFEIKTKSRVYENLGGTPILRVQIEKGMPCDVFLSANKDNVDQLVRKGLAEAGQSKRILSNSLVVVVPTDSALEFDSLKDSAVDNIDHIALADPDTVPAGIYAKEALVHFGVWERYKDKVVPAFDVRAAMALVESGNAQMAVVYKTDAVLSKKVRVAYEIPSDTHTPVEYWAVLIKDAKDPQLGTEFINFLTSPEARDIFRKYGFTGSDG